MSVVLWDTSNNEHSCLWYQECNGHKKRRNKQPCRRPYSIDNKSLGQRKVRVVPRFPIEPSLMPYARDSQSMVGLYRKGPIP